jgi:hypothetical protein
MTISNSQVSTEARGRVSKLGFWLELIVVVAIAVIAVFLRFHRIEQVPPGFNSDEAVGAVGALETLRSGPRLYYSGQGGGGSLGFYIAAISFAVFGPSVGAIRGAAAFAGVVGVVATYFATREMFRSGRKEVKENAGLLRAPFLAFLAALGLATSLWHTQSSRVAFAAVGVPFLQVPGNYFLWRGLNTGRRVNFVVSGILLASLMYIYLSGSFAPFVYLFFFLLQWLLVAIQFGPQSRDRQAPLLKRHLWNLVICAGVAFLLFLPMLYLYLTAPDLATERAQQALFTNPLINQGDPWGTLWRSFWGNLAAFGLSTSWFQGLAPTNLILPLPVSFLFLLGLVLSLVRVRQPPYLFSLVYWGVMLVPSILSPDSIPHSLRAVGAAPAAYILIAVGAMGIAELGRRIVGWGLRIRGRRAQIAEGSLLAVILLAVLVLVVAPSIVRGFYNYMVVWPKTNDAQAAYHVYAVELAAEMSKQSDRQATFLLPRDTAAGDVNPNYTVMFLYTGQAGYAWVVDNEETLEGTVNAALRDRGVVHVVRWLTSKHTGADPKELIRYYLEKNGAFLEKQSFEYFEIETYRLDGLGPDVSDGPLTPITRDFGGQLALTGYAFGDASGSGQVGAPSVPAGDLLWVRLRFTLTAPSDEDLKASVTVADGAGHVVGQVDKLLLNNILHQGSTLWQPGSEVEAYFLVPIAPATAPGDYQLSVAVYGAESLARLALSSGDGTQATRLGRVAVRNDLSPPSEDGLGLEVVLDQPVVDTLALLGLNTSAGGELRPGEGISVALVWRATEVPADDYQASLWAVLGEEAWPLTDPLPLAGIDYPSGNWLPGQVVRGFFDGRVPPELESGDYMLGVRVTDSGGTPVAELALAPLQVQGWPRQFEEPAMQFEVGAIFGDQIELLGYDVSAVGGSPETLGLLLHWRAISEMPVSYTAFVHLLDEEGRLLSQVDHVPGDGAFPTTGWLPGEVIADGYQLPLSDLGSKSVGQVEIGLYDPASGQRLPVLDDVGNQVDDKVLFSTVPETQ